MQVSDLSSFRSVFGLSSYPTSFTLAYPGSGCADPGLTGGEGEATLDAQWVDAVAPEASIVMAPCFDTGTTFGVQVALLGLASHAAHVGHAMTLLARRPCLVLSPDKRSRWRPRAARALHGDAMVVISLVWQRRGEAWRPQPCACHDKHHAALTFGWY